MLRATTSTLLPRSETCERRRARVEGHRTLSNIKNTKNIEHRTSKSNICTFDSCQLSRCQRRCSVELASQQPANSQPASTGRTPDTRDGTARGFSSAIPYHMLMRYPQHIPTHSLLAQTPLFFTCHCHSPFGVSFRRIFNPYLVLSTLAHLIFWFFVPHPHSVPRHSPPGREQGCVAFHMYASCVSTRRPTSREDRG